MPTRYGKIVSLTQNMYISHKVISLMIQNKHSHHVSRVRSQLIYLFQILNVSLHSRVNNFINNAQQSNVEKKWSDSCAQCAVHSFLHRHSM